MATRRSAIDPLLGLIAPQALASPVSAACAYGALASVTSFAAAALERRLVSGADIYWGSQHLIVHSYLSNLSTILDFALLNPLAILFLLRSRQIIASDPRLSQSETRNDNILRWIVSLCCAVLSILLMVAYSQSFLYGRFFDAIVTISDSGRSFVTMTGWVVFFWTGLFTYILISSALSQVTYVVRIARLRTSEVTYDPLHEDGAAGLRVLATPALEFTKASLVLLVTGVVFWIYDRVMAKAALTDRTASIAIFIVIVFPLFAIPIARLHYLMCDLREQLLRKVLGGEPRSFRRLSVSPDVERSDSATLKRLRDDIEAAEKLRSCVLSFPTWPMSTQTLVTCGAYFAGVAAPLIGKVAPLISGALGL
jgi:hypothetical protein